MKKSKGSTMATGGKPKGTKVVSGGATVVRLGSAKPKDTNAGRK
jgi:hypothetical protein